MIYKRTGSILGKEYMVYMVPAMLCAVGVSLSEFADSIIVGRLLGSDAFAVVNVASPVMLAISMIYTVIGVGGSLLYAESLGKKDRDGADRVFADTLVLSAVSSTLVLAVLLIFNHQVGTLFGCPESIMPEFSRYLSVLCFLVPVGVILMALSFFLPIIGMPYLSTGLVIAANVLNILLDVVFIQYADLGCEGAAMATLCSYSAVLVIGIAICILVKAPLRLRLKSSRERYYSRIVAKGLPAGIVQAGFAITTIFCNFFMNQGYGLAGVLAMSLFGQMDSIVSILFTGIIDNNAAFTAMLKGEGDHNGIRYLTRRVGFAVFTWTVLVSVLFALFSQPFASIFNIRDAGALNLIGSLTWIYVIHYPLRSVILLLRDVYNTLDRGKYATVLGILDKSVGIPVIGGGLYLMLGGTGLIMAFPVNAAVILVVIAIAGIYIACKSGNRYRGVLLLDELDSSRAVLEYSVHAVEAPAATARYIYEKCVENSVNPGTANKICLAVEEICLYIREKSGPRTPIDVLISVRDKAHVITVRNPGRVLCPIIEGEEDTSVNKLVLNKVFKVRHEYIFGLNSTRLILED